MDLIAGSDSESEGEGAPPLKLLRPSVNAAPSVALTAGRSNAIVPLAQSKTGELTLYNNPTKDVLYQPLLGPQNDADRSQAVVPQPQVTYYDEVSFQQERTQFQRSGQATSADGSKIYRTTLGYDPQRLEKMAEREAAQRKRPREEKTVVELVEGSDDEATYGVWAPPSAHEQWLEQNTISDFRKGTMAPEQTAERAYVLRKREGEEPDEEETAMERLVERKMSHLLPPKQTTGPAEASSEFHGSEAADYRGRSWIAPPSGLGSIAQSSTPLEMDHHQCRVPKKCTHRFTGHSQGVQRIRLFPRTGHLILSAGLDGTCKVWSVPEKQCMRTYKGHSAAVRDVQFNHTGTKFVSASFDRYLRLWDTETGDVLQTFTNKKVPYCVQFYPLDDNLFVVGCSDNKIVTYDATTAEITQEYNHHLGPVNAIVFVEDQGTKMVSSGDDKKILVWEWDIGVPIKYISDPTMHSMPSLTMHPSHEFFCGQSLDNTICVFQAGQRFAMQRKKKFSGHIVSGYACETAFSPDGRYLVSGDGNGAVFVWDWKRHKILQKFRAHNNGPAICVAWHPLEPSVLFSCGWDGTIKMWE